MNNETLHNRSKESRSPISVAEFMARWQDLPSGELCSLLNFPSDQEAQQIAGLEIEVSVMELPDGEVVIAKGQSSTETAFTRSELLALKPRKEAHTHPTQQVSVNGLKMLSERLGIASAEIDQSLVAKMGVIIPSPDDLTDGSVGAAICEIWNVYGKTTYRSYSNHVDRLNPMALPLAAKLYRSRDFLSVLVDQNLSIDEKVTKMNSILSVLGLSFSFQPWSK